MTIKPLGNRVLVKAVAQQEVTASGIVLPDTVDKEKKAQGEVVAVGQGEKITALKLQPGQQVLYGKYAGEEITVDNVDYKILSDEDVLAVLEA